MGGQTGVCVSGGRGSRRDLPVVAELGERGLADAARRCSHVLDAFLDSSWLRLSFFSWICASLLSCPDLRRAVTALVTHMPQIGRAHV